MTDLLLDLGLKKYDVALLLLCPIGAVLGSIAQVILSEINPHTPPNCSTTVELAGPKLAVARGYWLLSRLMLGAILGLVIALYFVGALQENLTTLAKIVALSILLGFAAPKLWIAQQRILMNQVDTLVQRALYAHLPKAEPTEMVSPPNPVVNTGTDDRVARVG